MWTTTCGTPRSTHTSPPRYSAGELDGKYQNKERLRDRFWLRKTWSPIVAYVAGWTNRRACSWSTTRCFTRWLEGGPVRAARRPVHHNGINSHFRHLKHHLNDNPDCHLEIRYSEELAHLVYAGADMLVVPSMFEPCGLAPMIAMRYGTVPVVRAVGGMVDTVFDRDYSARPPDERNGYVFHQADNHGHRVRAGPRARTVVGLSGPVPPAHGHSMRADYSWARPGPGLPEHLRAHPPQVSRPAGEPQPPVRTPTAGPACAGRSCTCQAAHADSARTGCSLPVGCSEPAVDKWRIVGRERAHAGAAGTPFTLSDDCLAVFVVSVGRFLSADLAAPVQGLPAEIGSDDMTHLYAPEALADFARTWRRS